MAQLRGLGQPFGSPGGIINVPAPAGSALAGQLQMQAMQGLGQALGQYLGQKRQQELWQQDQARIQNYMQAAQGDPRGTLLPPGQAGPQVSLPQMQSRQGQQISQNALATGLSNIFNPLETRYKEAQIGATEALTSKRKEEEKYTLPDRMLRQADRYLRTIDGIMGEYWYTPEGPYRDSLLDQVKGLRKNALRLIDKYAPNSDAAKAAKDRLEKMDKEVAAGKQSQRPGVTEQIRSRPTNSITGIGGKEVGKKRFVVDNYPAPKASATLTEKQVFDNVLASITSEREKDRWYELHYKPEYGK